MPVFCEESAILPGAAAWQEFKLPRLDATILPPWYLVKDSTNHASVGLRTSNCDFAKSEEFHVKISTSGRGTGLSFVFGWMKCAGTDALIYGRN